MRFLARPVNDDPNKPTSAEELPPPNHRRLPLLSARASSTGIAARGLDSSRVEPLFRGGLRYRGRLFCSEQPLLVRHPSDAVSASAWPIRRVSWSVAGSGAWQRSRHFGTFIWIRCHRHSSTITAGRRSRLWRRAVASLFYMARFQFMGLNSMNPESPPQKLKDSHNV